MECERCGKFLMLLHYDGVPTWVHPGKCLVADELEDLDNTELDHEGPYFWNRGGRDADDPSDDD